MLFATACRVDATVDVTVDDDGSGVVSVAVEMDDEALAALGDPVTAVPIDDLEANGWSVEEPEVDATGATLRASKPFENPRQFQAVMAELAGADGPLRDFMLERETPFAKAEWRLTGTIDLSGGIDAFGDEQLAELLGRPIGWTTADLESEIGKPLSETFGFELIATLPGDPGGNGTREDGGAMSWSARLGQEPVEVRGTGTADSTSALFWSAVALGALALLGFVLAIRLLRYMRRDSRGYVDPEPVSPHGGEDLGRVPVQAGRPPERQLRMVVLGGAGVVYEVADVVGRLLHPLARDLGSEARVDEVRELHEQTTLGRRTTMEFWQALGLSGDPSTYDRDFLLRVRLSPNLLPFLDRMRDKDLQVAVVDNDSSHWSTALRRRFGLDDHVDLFVVSAEVGARMPDDTMFETLRRASGVDPADMLFLAADEGHLAAAAGLGMATVWFAPPPDADVTDRRVVRGFGDFFK